MAQMDLSSWKVVYFLTLISASDHLISRKISHGNLSFYQPNPDTKLSKPQFGVHGHTSNPCDREGSMMIGQLAPGAHIHWPTLVRRTNASRHGAPPLPSPLRAPMHGEPALSRTAAPCVFCRASDAYFPASNQCFLSRVGIFPPIFPES